MNKKVMLTCAVVILMLCQCASLFAQADDTPVQDVLGPSDVIEVSVFNHPELLHKANVRADGWINMALAGDVYLSGLTPSEASRAIEQKLSRFIRNPMVSINIVESRSKKILVVGEVKTPGLYPYEGEMTVMNAIGLAGGYNKHAELKGILIARNASHKKDKPVFYLVNLHRLIHDADSRGNINLRPGDIVYVPLNAPGNIGECLDYFFSKVVPAAEVYNFIKD